MKWSDKNMNASSLRTLLCATVIGASATAFDGTASPLMSAAGGKPGRDEYVKRWGVRAQDFGRNFGSDGEIAVEQIESSAPCNMAYPGEKVALMVQVRNLTKGPLDFQGRWILLDESLNTGGEDVFDLAIVVKQTVKSEPVAIHLPANGVTHIQVYPDLSEKFGSSALLFEREDTGTRLFVSSLARIVEADLAPGLQFYQVCMDLAEAEAVKRLHTAPNRLGVPFVPSYDESCEKTYVEIARQLREIKETGFPICVEFGGGPSQGKYLPLGRTRPHLTEDNVLLETKSDYAWLPEYDAEFKERVKWIVKEFGYPRGPVNAIKLWNEPWNGISISGWGADDPRYREIYTAMCEGAEEAMSENPDIHVLLGGCDSSSNTFDKLFPDDDMKFLKWLDFLSLHYQGLSPSNPRFLRDRIHKNGRVRFWDTESWVANSGDRVPGTLAGMLAAGYDRLVGIQGHAVVATGYNVDVLRDNGARERRRQYNAWPVAPALAAFQHFVGNRKFIGLQWEGLPWIYKFKGAEKDDLTLVICGDIAPVFDGKGRTGIVPFRTARGEAPLNGTLRIADAREFLLYDGNGNPLPGAGNALVVPLNDASFYLRANGAPGSAAKLLEAVAGARIDGYKPVAPVFRDATRPINDGAVFTAELKNVLNREIKGALTIEADGLALDYAKSVNIAANATCVVPLKVLSGHATPENAYRFKLVFDAGADGAATLTETLHCNVIGSLTPKIDGILDEWAGALPQTVAAGGGGATMMEKAWLPMLNHEDGVGEGLAMAWLAADDDNFYFAARIVDSTVDEGMQRFETRDEDADFYPETVVQYDADKTVATIPAATKARMEGTNAVWSCLVNKMAFSVKTPEGGARVAVRFADDDGMFRRHYAVTVTDAATGRKIHAVDLRPQMEHTWLRMNVVGACRVEIATRNWLKPQVVVVALDPPEAGLDKPVFESDAGGGFTQQYGTMAMFRPSGTDAKPGSTEHPLRPESGSEAEASGPQAALAPFAFRWEDAVSAIELKWPEGVRRFSYRRRPDLPQGVTPPHDNVQLAFNVLPDDAKPWHPAAPGTFKGYAGYWDTDYEFALNPVALRYGGGVEIWKLRAPDLPDKHYYPRSPKHPLEGPVKNGKLAIKRDGQYRIVEAAIPWSEIPEVKTARDAGKHIKFSFRVNDNGGQGACMELAYMRSASKRNESFKPTWTEHWANEIEFGWEN